MYEMFVRYMVSSPSLLAPVARSYVSKPQPGVTPDPGDDYLIALAELLRLIFWCP